MYSLPFLLQIYAEAIFLSKIMSYNIRVFKGAFKYAAENGSVSFAKRFCTSERLRGKPQRDGLLAAFFSDCGRDSSELGQLIRSEFWTILVRGNRS